MLTELAVVGESVTAVLTSHLATGENFDGAMLFGIYPGNTEEIWIEFRGQRLNLQLPDVPAVIKQLKRAAKLAAEQETPHDR
jgi:hypothetical protein